MQVITFLTAAMAFGSSTLAAPYAHALKHRSSNKQVAVPQGLTNSIKGIPLGFAPDDSNPPTTLEQISAALGPGQKAATYHIYDSVENGRFAGNSLLPHKEDVINSGAVLIASVMPDPDFSAVTSQTGQDIANTLTNFTDAGVSVWLRYAHEMDFYSTAQGHFKYSGSAAEFQASWRNVANAVAGNEKILMFWCPNWNDVNTLQQWYPNGTTPDIVGMDVYAHNGGETFKQDYDSFYQTFAVPKQTPFVIAETGIANGGDEADKLQWLAAITSADELSNYPLYKAATWFEFNKPPQNGNPGQDFRVIVEQSTQNVKTAQANLALI